AGALRCAPAAGSARLGGASRSSISCAPSLSVLLGRTCELRRASSLRTIYRAAQAPTLPCAFRSR
ncbi:uncharacterized protein HMPREF1541_06184, partial [Cyphellophora europaea CBS 101466]